MRTGMSTKQQDIQHAPRQFQLRPLLRITPGVERVLTETYCSSDYLPLLRNDLEGSLSRGDAYLVGAYYQRKLVGFAGVAMSHMHSRVAELMWATVLPDNQGRGIGTALLENRILWAKNQHFTNLLVVTKPSSLYKNHGFVSLSKLKDGKHLLQLRI